ncbi:hypothetical protein NDU88_003104 [Pleurodeles waltl]|uniref:Uncharacterized protein n=1 Tax=Pleurodeles waltl TaxID=8319 RepID=A0AAV7SCI1_PLEWA|nr:hypothetical protein NDU88_003104 [Pleurodeles waltl]
MLRRWNVREVFSLTATTVPTSTTVVGPTEECPGGTLESDTCLRTYVHREVKTAYDQARGVEKNAKEVAEEAAIEGEDVGGDPEDAVIEGEYVGGSEDSDRTKQGGATDDKEQGKKSLKKQKQLATSHSLPS